MLTQLATDNFSSSNEYKSVWVLKDLSEQPIYFFHLAIIFFNNPLSFGFVYFQSLLHNIGSICLLNLIASMYANNILNKLQWDAYIQFLCTRFSNMVRIIKLLISKNMNSDPHDS